jgi:hypothetical protein
MYFTTPRYKDIECLHHKKNDTCWRRLTCLHWSEIPVFMLLKHHKGTQKYAHLWIPKRMNSVDNADIISRTKQTYTFWVQIQNGNGTPSPKACRCWVEIIEPKDLLWLPRLPTWVSNLQITCWRADFNSLNLETYFSSILKIDHRDHCMLDKCFNSAIESQAFPPDLTWHLWIPRIAT